MRYPGLFNSSYVPSPEEIHLINSPQNYIGPLLIGQISTTLLQGVFLVQYYEYFTSAKDHKKWNRWLVHVTAGLALLKLAYIWWLTWDTFISHYGDWAYLTIFNPLAIPSSLLNTVPTAVCQIFFIQRGWILSKNKHFVGPAIFFLIFYVGSGIAVTWSSILTAGGKAVVSKFGLISANASIISGLLCNLFITGFTCCYLVKEMTGTRKADDLVRKVIRISIESATGPTIASLLSIVLANHSSDNQWFLFPALTTSYVYGCSLLYSVNSRKRLNGMLGNTITSILYQPTSVESEAIHTPSRVIRIEGTADVQSDPADDQTNLRENALRIETDKIHSEFTPQTTTDGSLVVNEDGQRREINSSS